MREKSLLGAPGTYRVPDEPVRALTGVRMDVCAFLGVAPRGPARVPTFNAAWAPPPCGARQAAEPRALRSVAVPVESWDAYRRLYGGYEGPGLLPYAVASFFEQGGRRAYVVRIVHDHGGPADAWAAARGTVPGVTADGGGAVALRARSEGAWGNALRAGVGFRARPLTYDAAASTVFALALPTDSPVGAGTLLRAWLPGGVPVLRFVGTVTEEWRPETGQRVRRAVLEAALPDDPDRVEVVEGELTLDDGDGRVEVHERLGLAPDHPRFAAAVLYADSTLAWPEPEWIGVALRPDDAFLRPPPPAPAPQFSCGRDRYGEVTPDDFFDPRWVPGDECPGSGVHALAELADVAMVAAPDLYSPFPLVAPQAVHDAPTFAGATFQTCVEPEIPPAAPPAVGTCPDGLPADAPGSRELDGLRLDPTLPDERERIVGYQQRLVALADLLERWQVLLSVPPGLNHRQVLDWRTRFGSAYAAAYHPWLVVSRGKTTGEVPVRIPPCGVAAGIVARQELAFGIPHGPANVLAAGALAVADAVSPARHDELHPQGINVFLRERDGIRLSAARTLSRDPAWRQMSVRRLVTMLRRVLERQMQWAVFEPNNTSLREEVKRVLDVYLRQLYRANAFKGKTEREAFFVRCDEALNPPQVVDAGALIAHVGVAPAEPLEFILVRIARGGDGTLRLEG